MRSAVEDVPADYLAWFATRPGVTAGPVTDAEVAGVPASGHAVPGGLARGAFPCDAVDPRPCLGSLYFPAGLIISSAEGDAGTLYELTIDGRRLVVDVADADGAAALLASLEIVAS